MGREQFHYSIIGWWYQRDIRKREKEREREQQNEELLDNSFCLSKFHLNQKRHKKITQGPSHEFSSVTQSQKKKNESERQTRDLIHVYCEE